MHPKNCCKGNCKRFDRTRQSFTSKCGWDANFAKLVEYVGENFKQPSLVEGPTSDNGKTKLGKWYNSERNYSYTTSRGDCMQGMKAIVSFLYNRTHLRKLGSDEKIRVKKMISELKLLHEQAKLTRKSLMT